MEGQRIDRRFGILYASYWFESCGGYRTEPNDPDFGRKESVGRPDAFPNSSRKDEDFRQPTRDP